MHQQVNEDFLALYHANYGIKYDFGSSEGTSTSDDKPSAKEHEGLEAQKDTKPTNKGKREKAQGKLVIFSNPFCLLVSSNFLIFFWP